MKQRNSYQKQNSYYSLISDLFNEPKAQIKNNSLKKINKKISNSDGHSHHKKQSKSNQKHKKIYTCQNLKNNSRINESNLKQRNNKKKSAVAYHSNIKNEYNFLENNQYVKKYKCQKNLKPIRVNKRIQNCLEHSQQVKPKKQRAKIIFKRNQSVSKPKQFKNNLNKKKYTKSKCLSEFDQIIFSQIPQLLKIGQKQEKVLHQYFGVEGKLSTILKQEPIIKAKGKTITSKTESSRSISLKKCHLLKKKSRAKI